MMLPAEKARKAYGSLPEDWTSRRLRFDVYLNPKKATLDMKPDELVSFVPMDAVGEHGGLRLEETRELADVYDGYTYFADGDLCIAKITPCFENGKGALAESLTNGVGFGTTELHVIRPGPEIYRRFLFYISIADDFRKIGESEMYGAGGQKRIDESFIKDWMPPLPPLETQSRIARFLDDKTARIDGLIEKKRALLDRLAEKRQALITRAVTKGLNSDAPMKPSGISWLGDIPAHWEVFLIKRKFEVSYGVGGEIDRSLEEGTNLLSLPNITKDGRLNLDDVPYTQSANDSSLLRKGDLLFNWRNGSTDHLGKTVRFVLDGNWTNVSFLLRIRPRSKATHSGFLRYFLNGLRETEFFAYAKAGVNNTFNLFEVNNLPVISPPTWAEQKEIASYLDQQTAYIDSLSDQIQLSIDKLKEYRSAVITSAVTGQIEGLR